MEVDADVDAFVTVEAGVCSVMSRDRGGTSYRCEDDGVLVLPIVPEEFEPECNCLAEERSGGSDTC